MKNKIITGILVMLVLISGIVIKHKDYMIDVEDGTLYGTLTHESYDKCVIFISGSGPTDRNSNSDFTEGRNDALKELAKALNRKGISTFAYDKRTSGKSADTFDDLSNIDFADFINDAEVVLNEINQLGYKEIYLVGHSQGALICEIIGQDSRVNGIISLCGTVNTIDKTLLEQLKRQSDVDTYEHAVKIMNLIRQGEYEFDVIEPLEAMFRDKNNNRFLHSWMAYDPMDYIQPIEDKTLFIYGDSDRQVSHQEVTKLNANAQYVVVENMNHVLKTVINDHENMDSYTNPIYKINPKLVDIILSFIL